MTETTMSVTAATPNLNKALSLLQGKLPKVTKGNTADIPGSEGKRGYRYSYADLADVTAAVGPLLAEFGLAFLAKPTIDPANRGQMILVWKLKHESGEEEAGEYPLGPANQRPQSLGSMITYARRYCLGAATGIVAEDDDDGQRAQQDHGSRQSAGDLWDKSTPTPPRQDGSSGNGRQPQRQAERPVAAAPEGNAANAWLAAARRIIPDIGLEACQKMRREAIEKGRSGEEPPDDVNKVLGLLKARMEALANASRGAAAPPVAAALEPDDPWADAFRDAADAVEAERLLADLRDQAGRGEIDPGRAALVEQAAEELFPGITTMEKAA